MAFSPINVNRIEPRLTLVTPSRVAVVWTAVMLAAAVAVGVDQVGLEDSAGQFAELAVVTEYRIDALAFTDQLAGARHVLHDVARAPIATSRCRPVLKAARPLRTRAMLGSTRLVPGPRGSRRSPTGTTQRRQADSGRRRVEGSRRGHQNTLHVLASVALWARRQEDPRCRAEALSVLKACQPTVRCRTR